MKTVLAGLVSLVVLILGGWQLDNQANVIQPVIEKSQKATLGSGAVTGTWYSFPAGLAIRFNEDGTAHFGVDGDGNPIGYTAETWLEGETLSIRFTNYDGYDDLCLASTGVYQLRQANYSTIQFTPVKDECQLRVDVLRGNADLGFELVYHQFD